jgi:RND superfamily putative drug exporter
MGLPVGTAIAGIATGATIITLVSHVVSMPDFTTTLAVMIGLGVGIDYALFIVTRYREGLHNGLSTEEATSTAINTAGRAVLFAGTTVVISLCGMFVMGLAFVTGLAIGAALTVLATMVASVTLLPALLGFAKHRVEVTRWRGIIAATLVSIGLIGVGLGFAPLIVALPLALAVIIAGFFIPALRREVPKRAPKPVERTTAYRWSRLIEPPWPAVLGLPVFAPRPAVLLAAPAPPMRRDRQDHPAGLRPAGRGRPRPTGPRAGDGAAQRGRLAALGQVTQAIQNTPDVALVSAVGEPRWRRRLLVRATRHLPAGRYD